MPSKSLLQRGFKTKAEELAVKYRENLGLSKFKPLDAFKLAEHLDVSIFTVDEIFEGNELHPSHAKMNDKEMFDAMWMQNAYGDKIILYNPNHSKCRQQSSLMHEMAHLILKHEIPEEISKVCMMYNLHYYNKVQEQEAKFLGACLQLTKASLMWALKENWTHEKISEYYSASIDMVRFRLYSSGAIKQRNYMNE